MECSCEVERTMDPRCEGRGMCGKEDKLAITQKRMIADDLEREATKLRREADENGDNPEMTPAQKAYGTLWREIGVTSQLIRIARLQLRDGLTQDERRAAVAWSIETYGPVTDSEAIAADIQAGVFPEKSKP